jgi:hypothetical protein
VHAASAKINPAAIPPEVIDRFVMSLLSKPSRRKPTRQASRQTVNFPAAQKAYSISHFDARVIRIGFRRTSPASCDAVWNTHNVGGLFGIPAASCP